MLIMDALWRTLLNDCGDQLRFFCTHVPVRSTGAVLAESAIWTFGCDISFIGTNWPVSRGFCRLEIHGNVYIVTGRAGGPVEWPVDRWNGLWTGGMACVAC